MARRRRNKAPEVNGWLIVDKPGGITSTSVCNVVRRLAGGAKCGHGGTLDPLATGLLPVAFGEATKTVPYVMDGRKLYRFVVRWGEARDTDDAEGEVTATSDVRPDAAAIEAALPAFRGRIMQTPPVYSAIKVAGERAYDMAREGRVVELPAREISIGRFDLAEIIDRDHAAFEVESGKGAYMRSLARDLALALGTVGHIAELRRLRVGPFTINDAISLESLTEIGHIQPRFEKLLPVETALADIPALAVTGGEAADLRTGKTLQLIRKDDLDRLDDIADGDVVRAEEDGRLVALVRLEDGGFRPLRVLHR